MRCVDACLAVTAAIHLSAMSTGECLLRLEQRDGGWVLAGPGAERFGLVNEYLAYLADRNYSPKTVRAYGFDLLAFCRWLVPRTSSWLAVTTEVLLRFLRACRQARVPGRPGPNVVVTWRAAGWTSTRRPRSTTG